MSDPPARVRRGQSETRTGPSDRRGGPGSGGGSRHGTRQDARRHAAADREAVRQGRGHEAGRAPDGRRHRRSSPRARSRSTSRSASAASRAGAIVEVFGPEGSGKTTVCLHIIAEAQKKGGIAAFIDAEHALDPTYARELGVNIDELLVSQPDSGEQALEIADMLVRSGARRPRGDRLGGGAGAAGRDRGRDGRHPRRAAGAADVPGHAQARRLAVAVRHDGDLHQPAAREDRRDVRHPRDHAGRPGAQVLLVGAARRAQDREPQGRHRGRGLAHARQGGQEQGRPAVPPVPSSTSCTARASPRRAACIDVGVDLEIIKKAGAWFTYEGEQLGQGKENARAFLAEHTDIRDEIERKVREAVGLIGFTEDDDKPIQIDPGSRSTWLEAARQARQGRQEGRVGAWPPTAGPAGSGRTSTSGRSGSLPCDSAAAGSSSAGSSRPASSPRRSPTNWNVSSRSGFSTTRPSLAPSSRAGWASGGSRAVSSRASWPRRAWPARSRWSRSTRRPRPRKSAPGASPKPRLPAVGARTPGRHAAAVRLPRAPGYAARGRPGRRAEEPLRSETVDD